MWASVKTIFKQGSIQSCIWYYQHRELGSKWREWCIHSTFSLAVNLVKPFQLMKVVREERWRSYVNFWWVRLGECLAMTKEIKDSWLECFFQFFDTLPMLYGGWRWAEMGRSSNWVPKTVAAVILPLLRSTNYNEQIENQINWHRKLAQSQLGTFLTLLCYFLRPEISRIQYGYS